MYRRILLFTILLACLFVQHSVSAQSQPITSSIIYVRIGDMNQEEFLGLHAKLKTDARFEIQFSCHEAKALSVIVPKGQELEKSFNDFKTLLINHKPMEVTRLSGFDEQKFLDLCMNARNGH